MVSGLLTVYLLRLVTLNGPLDGMWNIEFDDELWNMKSELWNMNMEYEYGIW